MNFFILKIGTWWRLAICGASQKNWLIRDVPNSFADSARLTLALNHQIASVGQLLEGRRRSGFAIPMALPAFAKVRQAERPALGQIQHVGKQPKRAPPDGVVADGRRQEPQVGIHAHVLLYLNLRVLHLLAVAAPAIRAHAPPPSPSSSAARWARSSRTDRPKRSASARSTLVGAPSFGDFGLRFVRPGASRCEASHSSTSVVIHSGCFEPGGMQAGGILCGARHRSMMIVAGDLLISSESASTPMIGGNALPDVAAVAAKEENSDMISPYPARPRSGREKEKSKDGFQAIPQKCRDGARRRMGLRLRRIVAVAATTLSPSCPVRLCHIRLGSPITIRDRCWRIHAPVMPCLVPGALPFSGG